MAFITTEEIPIGRAGTGADLSPYPLDRVSNAPLNFDPKVMMVPLIPDHSDPKSQEAHDYPEKAMGHGRTMSFNWDTLEACASFIYSPMCVKAIKDNLITGISYSIGYISRAPFAERVHPDLATLPAAWKEFMEYLKRGRFIQDYFDHIAFLIGIQQNHPAIGHPLDTLKSLEEVPDDQIWAQAEQRSVWTSQPIEAPKNMAGMIQEVGEVEFPKMAASKQPTLDFNDWVKEVKGLCEATQLPIYSDEDLAKAILAREYAQKSPTQVAYELKQAINDTLHINDTKIQAHKAVPLDTFHQPQRKTLAETRKMITAMALNMIYLRFAKEGIELKENK